MESSRAATLHTVWTGCHTHRWPILRSAGDPSTLCVECLESHALTVGWSHGLLFLRRQVHHRELVRKLSPPRMQDLVRGTPVRRQQRWACGLAREVTPPTTALSPIPLSAPEVGGDGVGGGWGSWAPTSQWMVLRRGKSSEMALDPNDVQVSPILL